MDRARFAFVYSIVVGLAFLAFAIVACKVIVGPAAAQQVQCDMWERFKSQLEQSGFHKAGVGLISETGVLVIMENVGGERWYLFVVGADGSACLIQEGTDWYPAPEPEPLVPGRRPA